MCKSQREREEEREREICSSLVLYIKSIIILLSTCSNINSDTGLQNTYPRISATAVPAAVVYSVIVVSLPTPWTRLHPLTTGLHIWQPQNLIITPRLPDQYTQALHGTCTRVRTHTHTLSLVTSQVMPPSHKLHNSDTPHTSISVIQLEMIINGASLSEPHTSTNDSSVYRSESMKVSYVIWMTDSNECVGSDVF